MTNKEKISQAINLLKELDLTNEIVEDILEEIGMREKMISQILDSEKYFVAEKVWKDIFNNDTLIYKNFQDYYQDKFLSQE